jgi:hypothetical protein
VFGKHFADKNLPKNLHTGDEVDQHDHINIIKNYSGVIIKINYSASGLGERCW